jgi:hypothetical protein
LFEWFKKAGIGFRCHAALMCSLTFVAEHNTDHRRKKCPPQEPAFLLTFLALKKVRRLAGRAPPVMTLALDFDLQ